MPWWALAVTAADVDGDNRLDIISGGWWYRNPGNFQDTPWPRHSLGDGFQNMAWVHDFDQDGDWDVFGSVGAANGAAMGWTRNDGAGNFALFTNVAMGQPTFFQGVAGGVFLTDAPYQIFMQWNGGEDGTSGVEVYTVPADPAVELWSKAILDWPSAGEALSFGDIDGDGDPDLFQGASWLRNEGDGTWSQFPVATFPPEHGDVDRNVLADLDGDGDLDAVIGFSDFSTPVTPLIWLEQPEEPTQPWIPHTIIDNVWGGLNLDVADLDLDGDIDLVYGEENGATRVLIFENRDAGAVWVQHLVDPGGPEIDHHDGTQLFDLDGDGDLDIISIGLDVLKLWVFENLSGHAEDTEPPTAPTTLQARSASADRIELSWAPSTDNWGVTGYRVLRDGVEVGVALQAWFLDAELTPESEYAYEVIAFDANGNESEPSNRLVASTLGLVWASYSFEEDGPDVLDQSGNDFHAALEGEATHTALGCAGQAIRLSKPGGRVNMGGFDPGGSSWSAALWFKADQFEVHDARLVSKAVGTAEQEHFLMISTIGLGAEVGLRFRLKTEVDGTTTLISTGHPLLPEVWTHVAATYDGAQMTLYQNGMEVAAIPKTGALVHAPEVPAWIGANPDESRFFTGCIDEFRCYSIALSPEAIRELMRTTASRLLSLRVTLTPSPLPSTVQVSWPGALHGFVLQEATQPGPTALWLDTAGPVSVDEDRHSVILPMVPEERYFRLRSELTEPASSASVVKQ